VGQDLLPVLAQKNDMRIVEVEGQPVVTARDLARALGYSREDAISRLYKRNETSFTDRDTFEIDLRRFNVNLTVNLQGGDPHVRVFTKRGALKICMKSNQPRAVMVQEALIDLYEQVERGQLVSVGYLHDVVRELKSEVNRLSRLVTGAEGGRNVQPAKVVQLVYISRRRKPRSFDDAALEFLQKLFNSKPNAKVAELDRQLRGEAARKGWKVGSTDSVYRAVATLRKAAKGLIQ